LPRDTPLCPAGHLPHKGGDRYAVKASPNINVDADGAMAPVVILLPGPSQSTRTGPSHMPLSPLVGEMPGRAEGGEHPHEHPPQYPNGGSGRSSGSAARISLVSSVPRS